MAVFGTDDGQPGPDATEASALAAAAATLPILSARLSLGSEPSPLPVTPPALEIPGAESVTASPALGTPAMDISLSPVTSVLPTPFEEVGVDPMGTHAVQPTMMGPLGRAAMLQRSEMVAKKKLSGLLAR